MLKKLRISTDQALHGLAKYIWLIMVTGAFFLMIFEVFEIVVKNESLIDPFHIIELSVFFIILTFLGALLDFIGKMNKLQNHTMKILDFKHTISMELTMYESWEAFTNELARLPSTLAGVEASRLLIYDSIFGQWESIAFWSENSAEEPTFLHDCQKCLEKDPRPELLFTPCDQSPTFHGKPRHPMEYCLPINYADSLLAVIQFRLKTGERLSNLQREIFDNIQYEIALALKASLEQKRLAEIQLAETALAERHSLTAYLHDSLSQNLAYLCLKLDQFISQDEQIHSNGSQKEFLRMREAANESYVAVRGMIETTYPETTPHFVNLMAMYGKKVSRRSDIEITFDRIGLEIPVPPEVQQEIIYIFQEILSNVEKHSQAENAKVTIIWGKDSLTITVADDGIGFDPQAVDQSKHFGMEIVKERLQKIEGQIEIQSSPGAETEVTLFIPIPLF